MWPPPRSVNTGVKKRPDSSFLNSLIIPVWYKLLLRLLVNDPKVRSNSVCSKKAILVKPQITCVTFVSFTDLRHRVVIYGEDTYLKKVVFHLSALKPNLIWFLRHPEGVMTLTNLKISLTSIGNQIGQIEKNSVLRRYQKPLEPGSKAQDPASCRVLSPILWHKIRWFPWKVWKSALQTNNTKELKTQGAQCQGPAYM